MISTEERRALATINPELQELLKTAPAFDLNVNSDINAVRATWAAAKKARKAAAPPSPQDVPYEEEDRKIGPMRDGAFIGIRIHRPKNPPADGSPIFVVYHGGGFCLGDLDSEVDVCREWVKLGGTAVNVDYRMAPEYPFPIPAQDAFDALKWTATHLNDLRVKISPKKGFLVGGVSAGANLSAVVSHLYRDEGLQPPLTGIYLAIPSVCEPSVIPEKYKDQFLSREQNKAAPFFNKDTLALFAKLYQADFTSPLRSPLLFPSHKDLPPTYFQICGMDPLRDDGLIYEEVLREEYGVKTQLKIYPGLPHAFWSAFPTGSFVQPFKQDRVKGLEWLLEQSK